MTLKHELLLIGILLAAMLGAVHAIERGDTTLTLLAQKVLPRG